MAKDNNLSDFLKDIADALREKLGITEPINPQEFSTLIKSIEEYETVGEAVDRIINEIPSLVANGTLTDTKWAKVSTVKGNSVVWNQLVNHSHWKSTTNNGVTFTVEDDGKIIVNGTSTGLARIMINPYIRLKANHKYALTGTPNNANGAVLRYFGTGLRDEGNGSILSVTADANNALAIEVTEGLIANNVIFYPQLTDLTQMFGAGNEPTTIEEFESRKPIGVTNDYNEGEIISYQQWGEKVVWNQLADINTKTGFAIVSTLRAYTGVKLPQTLSINHQILVTLKSTLTDKDGVIPNIYYQTYIGDSVGMMHQKSSAITNGNTSYFFVTPNTDTRKAVGVCYFGTSVEGDTLLVENIFVYDLTLMFGEGNEPTTIEEFERRRPRNVSNEYNEGTEISGDIEIKTVGLNQWDEEWEVGTIESTNGGNSTSKVSLRSKNLIPVIGGKKYKYVAPYNSATRRYAMIFFYGNNKKYIKNVANIINGSIITMPTEAYYCRIMHQYYIQEYGTYNNDICLHLVQDGLVSQYKPYTSTTTPLPNVSLIKDADGNQLFPYGLCSAGSVYDEITETKAIKRVGVVDMGTLSWMHRTVLSNKPFQTSSLKGLIAKSSQINILCAKYTSNVIPGGANAKLDKHLYRLFTDNGTNNHVILIKDDDYTDADSFKQAMQGVLLYYELATPIEVEIDKWKAEYKVEQGGTEQIVSANDTTNLKTDIIYGYKI